MQTGEYSDIITKDAATKSHDCNPIQTPTSGRKTDRRHSPANQFCKLRTLKGKHLEPEGQAPGARRAGTRSSRKAGTQVENGRHPELEKGVTRIPDEKGRHLDEKGRHLDEEGRHPDGKGRHLDGEGRHPGREGGKQDPGREARTQDCNERHPNLESKKRGDAEERSTRSSGEGEAASLQGQHEPIFLTVGRISQSGKTV